MGDNIVPEMVTVLVVLYTISILFTALRVYVRVFISKNWGADDTLLIATLVSNTCNRSINRYYVADWLHRLFSPFIQ
jgi:hypothetical protein